MVKVVPIFYGQIKFGKLLINNLDGFRDYLASLADGEVKVVVRANKADRSQRQNRYYWGVLVEMLSNYTGFEKDEMHEVLKWKFLRDQKELNGEVVEFSRSTTSLNTAEFEDYAEQCRRWALKELNVLIPLPNEVDFW